MSEKLLLKLFLATKRFGSSAPLTSGEQTLLLVMTGQQTLTNTPAGGVHTDLLEPAIAQSASNAMLKAFAEETQRIFDKPREYWASDEENWVATLSLRIKCKPERDAILTVLATRRLLSIL